MFPELLVPAATTWYAVFARNRMYLTGTNVFAKCNDVVIESNYLYQPADSQGAGIDFSGDNVTISGNVIDCSAASAGGANHPFRCTASAANVTITGNVFRCGYAGCKSTGGTDWTVNGNVIVTVAGSTDAATATALNLAGVTGLSATSNRILGEGAFNSLTGGDRSVIVGNFLDANGYIQAGNHSRVIGNRVTSAPVNGAGPGTFSAVSAGTNSVVQGNEIAAGTTAGAIATGATSIVSANIIENTVSGGYYVFANSAKTYCLDNLGVATAALGTFGGSSDGFVCGGTGSVKRVL